MDINKLALELAEFYDISLSETGAHTVKDHDGKIRDLETNSLNSFLEVFFPEETDSFGDFFQKSDILISNVSMLNKKQNENNCNHTTDMRKVA